MKFGVVDGPWPRALGERHGGPRASWICIDRQRTTDNGQLTVSFSQSTITRVNPPVQHGTQLLLSWTRAHHGTVYQVYLNQELSLERHRVVVSIPLPTAISRIDVGTVGPGESQVDFAPRVAAGPCAAGDALVARRYYQGADIVGFHIYGRNTRGRHRLHDGRGDRAGLRRGNHHGRVRLRRLRPRGYGQSAGATRGPRSRSGGTWNWGVKPFDTAGNEGPAQTAAVTIAAPPLPPAPFSDMTRLQYTYDRSTKQGTLNWNAS